MNILMAFNSAYLLPALVMVRSLLLNNSWCGNITIYVMHLNLKEEEIRRFREAAAEFGNGRAVFVQVPEDAFANAPLHLKWISRETYYRLLAQELLPETVERILWLDADMIVRGSLEDFYNQNMEGNLLVACSSHAGFRPTAQELQQRTLPGDTDYFNAGVLLYDLKGQRQEIDPAVYQEYPVLFYRQLKYGDQDVLNAVFYGMTKIADYRIYNMYDFFVFRQEDVEQVKEKALIFHYNGKGKPWTEYYWGQMEWLFWEYAMAIPEYAAQYEDIAAKQAAYRSKYAAGLSAQAQEKIRKRKERAL